MCRRSQDQTWQVSVFFFKVIEFVCLSVFLSKEILRWRELATSRTSECIRRFETLLSYLSVPATGLTCSHSLGFLLFSYYLVHFVSHFIYGHQSCPQIICHVYTYIYAHACAQQLTLHSGCGLCSLWPMQLMAICMANMTVQSGVCVLVSFSCL